jgi:hypothetical protein
MLFGGAKDAADDFSIGIRFVISVDISRLTGHAIEQKKK